MTTRHVEIDGGTLSVEVEGDGPLIICAPGLGDFSDAFAPLAEYFVPRGYRVVRFDLRGHGDSTAGFGHYGDEAIASDFLALIDAFGGGPAVLAGAAMSAAGAVIAAGRNPEKVSGLVLLGPFLRNGSGKMIRWLFQVALSRPWGPAIWRYSAAKLWVGLGDKAKERAARSATSLTRPGRWAAFHATSGTDHDVVAPWLDQVQAPVLVVIGDADPDWKDPLEEAKWIQSNFTDAQTITVAGAGHAPMLERPAIVNPAMLEFLEGHGIDGGPVPAIH